MYQTNFNKKSIQIKARKKTSFCFAYPESVGGRVGGDEEANALVPFSFLNAVV